MRQHRKNIIVACIVVFICAIFVCYVIFFPQQPKEGIIDAREIRNCEVSIHNMSTRDGYQFRTVPDQAFADKLMDICLNIKGFRPITTADMLLGTFPQFAAKLTTETVKYTIVLSDYEAQLDLNGSHRAEPILELGKDIITDNGSRVMWAWHCTLDAANYARLFDLIATYDGGELLPK